MVQTRFDDIGSLKHIKQALFELISLPLLKPELFARGVAKEAVSGVLLFGPPGTGKTMLARAVAVESGSNFLAISMSSIFDMWVGEGEKNVKVNEAKRTLSTFVGRLYAGEKVSPVYSVRGRS